MSRSRSVLVFVALAACTPTVNTTTGPARASVSAERIAADIRTVSADSFLGRGPATRGEELTTNYIRD